MASSLEASVEAKLDAIGGDQWRATQTFTIFRVPAYVRESNRTAYEPRVVSIGPYYHGDAALRAMEDHKWRYLRDVLHRRVTAVTASALIQEMRVLEGRARACYSERPVDMDADDFVRMLLLDGCFILEFFIKWNEKEPNQLRDVGWGLTLVIADMLLMENQIPFFVVEKLFGAVAGTQGSRQYLLDLLVKYIDDEKPITPPSSDLKVHHLLHLYYECFVPKRRPPAASPDSPPAKRIIPRATELCEAGVTLVLGSVERNSRSFDVTFDSRRGVMEIPAIKIDDMKRPLLVNLIAFEQTLGEEEASLLTSYVALIGQLIVTARDVELLRQRSILESLLTDDEAIQFFSHLGNGTTINYDRQAFSVLYEDVHRYCGSWWPRNRAALRRDYFGSPWSVISVVVAALVVFLTATQTYFTVFPAKK